MNQKPCPYLGFDDRKYIFFGLVILSILIPIFFFQRSIFPLGEFFLEEMAESFYFAGAYWLYCRFIIILLRKRFDGFNQSVKRLWIQMGILIITLPIIGALISGSVFLFYHFTSFEDHFEPSHLQSIFTTYTVSLVVILLYEIIYYVHKYKEAIIEKKNIEHEHTKGQLENLRNQINPHFLFNSMNTLMNLIPMNPDRATNYLSKLSKFYRYTVSNKDEAIVPLTEELEHVKIYADILQERFQEGLIIRTPESIPHSAKVIPLCLQLLIENAVKHNVVGRKKPLTISISTDKKVGFLTVSNNIQKRIQEVKSTGLGLKNIKDRVAYFSKKEIIITETESNFSVSVPLIYSDYKI